MAKVILFTKLFVTENNFEKKCELYRGEWSKDGRNLIYIAFNIGVQIKNWWNGVTLRKAELFWLLENLNNKKTSTFKSDYDDRVVLIIPLNINEPATFITLLDRGRTYSVLINKSEVVSLLSSKHQILEIIDQQ